MVLGGAGRCWAGPGGFFRVRGGEKIIKSYHVPNFRTIFCFLFFWLAREPGGRHRAREAGPDRKISNKKQKKQLKKTMFENLVNDSF